MIDTTWKSRYDVGNPRIDFEHRVFLDLIGHFAREVERDATSRRVVRLCAEIYKYAEFHFFSEEGMLEEAGSLNLQEHRKLHRDLLAQLNDFIQSVSLDAFRVNQMVEFLVEWFISHTTTEDIKHAHQLDKSSPYAR